MRIMKTDMRTQKSDLPLPPVLTPVQPQEPQPDMADTDVPPTTRPESGLLQLFWSLKYIPIRASRWPFTAL